MVAQNQILPSLLVPCPFLWYSPQHLALRFVNDHDTMTSNNALEFTCPRNQHFIFLNMRGFPMARVTFSVTCGGQSLIQLSS